MHPNFINNIIIICKFVFYLSEGSISSNLGLSDLTEVKLTENSTGIIIIIVIIA